MPKRWIQLGSAVVAMIMIANLQYAWTKFVNPMQDTTHWKLSSIQWAFTLFITFETWITPVEGWLIDRLGPRIFLSMGGLLVGIGWTSLAFAHSLMQLYVFYSIAGIGAALRRSRVRASAQRKTRGHRRPGDDDRRHQAGSVDRRLRYCRTSE